MEIIPESEWIVLCKELIKRKGTLIIIGATDSGKTSLSKYLIKSLFAENIRACLVDSDVGQSSLGLPGTISMKVFCNEKDLKDFMFDRMSFVGTINPAKKISIIIDTTKNMVAMCRKQSDITLVDTSGLVAGEIGKSLKIGKIKAVKPDRVIAIQRHDELEHILKLVENFEIHRIRSAKAAKIRTIATRTHYRKKKLRDYFNDAKIADFLLYSNEAKFFYNNKPFIAREGMFKTGTLIGLNQDEDTIAVGILDEITENSVTFTSPIKALKRINKVVFGDMTI